MLVGRWLGSGGEMRRRGGGNLCMVSSDLRGEHHEHRASSTFGEICCHRA